MDSTLRTGTGSSPRATAPRTAPRPLLATARRQLLATDVLVFGFLVMLLAWIGLSQLAPAARLYAYEPGFAWAELPPATLALQLTGYGLVYVVLQRLGVRHHALAAANLARPAWLSAANIAYVLSPIAIIPFVFNLLGAFMAGVSGVPGAHLHPDFDAAVHYDRAATYWDLWLKQADVALFGVYPPQWMRQFQTPWLTGVMMVCYLAYYVSPLVAIVPQLRARNWPVVRRISAVYAACLLTTYFGYLAIPATGPRFEGGMQAWLPAEPGWFGAQWWAHVINDAEIIRWDAFPSGHVAVALVTLVLALRYHRRAGLVYLPFVAGLVVATVFLGYHYATDVVFGFVFAAFTFVVLEPAIRWWESAWYSRPTSPSAP
ncbi:MAG: phosphatase PAP2 family protein [Planctomycetes bacterium]|jgi:membrane-associated phospholipid phosphatase|nr:phosphatase PAP2 family protein [Planctomycetota bacterium]MCL4730016.1 phosphatase PAP2 family protein [Planctomycetota bacterium]